jgi:uncharacterized membrane protein YbhN (UPF0104 family)
MGLATVMKALRFKILLSKVVKVPSMKMINLTFLSQLLSFTIPIRIGEVTKAVYLSTDYGLHFGKAVVWVFLDRFLDFWAVLALSLVLLSIIPTSLPRDLSGFLFLGAGGASLIIIMVVMKPEMFKTLARVFSNLLILKVLKEKFLSFANFLIDCFVLLKGSLKRNLGLLVLTVGAAFCEGLSWYLILVVFIPDVSVLKVWLGSMLNALTFIIPAAPGYVGSAEAAGLAVFTYGLGLDKTFVSASTIVIHALSLIYILGTGIYGLYNLKFNLGLVWKKLLKK